MLLIKKEQPYANPFAQGRFSLGGSVLINPLYQTSYSFSPILGVFYFIMILRLLDKSVKYL